MATFVAAPSNWTNVTNDANFRAWGSYISARMDAVGLTMTADTGQINWTTVLNPGATNTFAGYEIRTFTDSLQASAPVYFKIEYGEGTSADAPCVRVQFGSGSNGTGTLTGNLSTIYYSAVSSVTGACIAQGSGGTARFCMVGGFTTTASGTYGMWFGFERSKDATGADTTEAVLLQFGQVTGASGAEGNARIWGVWNTSTGNVGLTTAHTAPCLFPPGTTGVTGTQTVIAPIMHTKGVWMNPCLNWAGYYTGDIVALSSPSIYMYGTLHTYFALQAANAASANAFQGVGGGTEALLMRYE